MRTTLSIDDDLLAVAKNLAEQRSISLGAAVSELMRRGLEAGSAVTYPDSGGLPTFQVSAGAAPITSDDVKRLEDEV